MSRIASMIASILIGILLKVALIWSWAHIAASNPLPDLLIRRGLSGLGLWTVIISVDFLLNVAMCLLPAWLLLRLDPSNIRINTLLAVAAFATAEAVSFGLPLMSYGIQVAIPYTLTLLSLPTATWLLSKLIRNAPNNSFKPTPLRGAA